MTSRRVRKDERGRVRATSREVQLHELAGDRLEELGLSRTRRLRRRHFLTGEGPPDDEALAGLASVVEDVAPFERVRLGWAETLVGQDADERRVLLGEPQLASAGVALLTTREVADALHVHPRTVQRLVERGELAVVRLGASIRFDPAELVRLIAERTRTARSPEPQSDTVRPRRSGVSFAKRLRSQPA